MLLDNPKVRLKDGRFSGVSFFVAIGSDRQSID